LLAVHETDDRVYGPPLPRVEKNEEAPLRIRLPGGTTEDLSEEEARHLCDALWTLSDLKGSIALLGKISHESRSL
jgi:hypothetical protein